MTASRLFALAAIYCAGVGAAAQISKLVPVLSTVGAWYGVDLPSAALLVTAIGVCGCAFGMVVGDLVSRAGLARALAGAVALAVASGLALPLAPSLGAAAAIRVIESLTHLVIVTAAPGLMTRLVPPERRAAILAIWGSFFGIAFVGSQSLAAAGLAAAAPVAFLQGHVLLFIPFLLAQHLAPLRATLREERACGRWGVRVPSLAALLPSRLDAGMLASLAFAFHSGSTTALLTLVPVEAQSRFSLAPPDAAALAAGLPVVWLVATLLASVVLSRTRSVPMTVAGCILVVASLAALAADPSLAVVTLSLAFVGYGCIQAAVFARIGELARDPADVARLSGSYTQLGNIGILVCAPLVAAIMPILGALALPLCAAAGAVGILGLCLASARAARSAPERAAA